MIERIGNVFVRLHNIYNAVCIVLNGGLIKGKWSDVRLWENQAALDAFLRGENVSPIWEHNGPNGITNEGMHYVLEVAFRSDAMSPVAQLAPWAAGLIDDASFTAVAAGDTMASHAGWIEATQYTEADRQTLAFGAAAARAITAQVSFTMNATKTIRGLFITSDDTKSGTTGTLFSTALFASPPSVINGNVLTANYSLTD